MKIHLVTFATPRFRLRQLLLGWSARVNRVVDTVTHWTPESLLSTGFEERCANIKLSERGSGFWAWKPFIIEAKLREVADGDIVFYCDVGRSYPFKLLDQPISPYLLWMEEKVQDLMPGVYIPWDGLNEAWTKREAFVATDLDHPEVHASAPVQASFSIWKASPQSREIAARWMGLCSQRQLVSDDPSREGLAELPGFRAHRHDQALLTLSCIREEIVALDLGSAKSSVDAKNPSDISRFCFGNAPGNQALSGRILKVVVQVIGAIEQPLRRLVKFGKPIHE